MNCTILIQEPVEQPHFKSEEQFKNLMHDLDLRKRKNSDYLALGGKKIL